MGVGDGVEGSCGCCRATGEVHGKDVMGASASTRTENSVMAGRTKSGGFKIWEGGLQARISRFWG